MKNLVSFANIAEFIKGKGITKPVKLQERTGLAYATCYQLLKTPEKVKGITEPVLQTLCDAFACSPNQLLLGNGQKKEVKA